HMDDFYLPFHMRSKERLHIPGGNIHYERFYEEIYKPIKNLKNKDSNTSCLNYHIFSCQDGSLKKERVPLTSPLIIIEGSYCMHEQIRDLYDYSIFMDISPSLQQKRLQKRVGSEALKSFNELWIPLENLYFNTGIPKLCTKQFTVL
ncbi:hypothetical protein LJC58_09810, partial [Lachnospiraceae bacterium OttesenSCG-928-D06]|nr:hypothetical protein [Lachnospiraceae bacterium OttesenSCG-928-D06]